MCGRKTHGEGDVGTGKDKVDTFRIRRRFPSRGGGGDTPKRSYTLGPGTQRGTERRSVEG